MDCPSQTDVLISGAGPTGLVAACILLQNGIKTTLIDAAPAPATTSRAMIIHLRTLEVLEKIAVVDTIVKEAIPATGMALRDRSTVLNQMDFASLHPKYQTAALLPQSDTERILTDRLHALGGRIYRGVALTSLKRNDATGVEVEVSHTATNQTQTITAKYVVAADGGKSTLRHLAGISFDGAEYKYSFLTADVTLDSDVFPHQSERDKVAIYMGAKGFLLLIPIDRASNDHWRIVTTMEGAPKHPDKALVESIVRERGPKECETIDREIVKDIPWGGHFRIQHRLASKYRNNRVFLAGDAAHVHSPAGGQGMNTGIQDAEFLASSILVPALLQSRDSQQDLDRYESERRPIAERVVSLTHQLTTMGSITNPWLCWARNWAVWLIGHGWLGSGFKTQMARRISELDH